MLRIRISILACGLSLLANGSAKAETCPLSGIYFGNSYDNAVPGPDASRHANDDYGAGTVQFVSWGDTNWTEPAP